MDPHIIYVQRECSTFTERIKWPTLLAAGWLLFVTLVAFCVRTSGWSCGGQRVWG